ncbi:restriction endonuclease [Streptomyces jumonjinensis]|uniref:Restriction endonuclease n=1 Tax=Streptomyces jumonjinensis TaxID=1945 RepID=A0A646KM37_STRJU|nr:restriction endonuclease [Streptomyces jumonjinensis]MQT03011.1 restriction endonuclease [Streptomyces jumonjinensis]
MSDTHAVLYDPHGLIEAEHPPDRAPHEALVTAVPAWKNPDLEPRDYEQIALQLTRHARAVAAGVRRAADLLPEDHAARALADVVLEEADRRLSVPLEGTARCAQRPARPARLVRALYERLDRVAGVAPQAVTTP